MAYRRNAPKPDIRSLNIKSVDTTPITNTTIIESSKSTLVHHNPLKELRLIGIISAILLTILLTASYLDTTEHWVIPFAQWLTNLG